METIDLRRLVIRSFHVKGVEFADKFEFSNGILKIDKKITILFNRRMGAG